LIWLWQIHQFEQRWRNICKPPFRQRNIAATQEQ